MSEPCGGEKYGSYCVIKDFNNRISNFFDYYICHKLSLSVSGIKSWKNMLHLMPIYIIKIINQDLLVQSLQRPFVEFIPICFESSCRETLVFSFFIFLTLV